MAAERSRTAVALMLLHMYTDCRLSWLCARYKGAAC